MKKCWRFLPVILLGTALLQGCKKNFSEETYTPITNPITPDFTTKVTAAVNGFITDENGNAVQDANVKAGDITVVTDRFGYFKISNAAFAKSAGFIQATKSGYFAGYKTFLPIQGKESFTRLQLIPKTISGNIESVTGGAVSIVGGATVTLPANAAVVASTNAVYNGGISIATYWLNPAEEQTTQLTMPGNLTGVDTAGHLNVLQTYGMLAVELTGSNGELLQIAQGKKASLHIPIPASLTGSAPAVIPLWYFDESKGVWQQEGRAIKNGSSYDGEVSHFSYWNCDVPYPLVNFTAQIVDTALRPLSTIPVSVTVANRPFPIMVEFTDTNGIVNGMVPADNSLSIGVIAPCNETIIFRTITSASTAIDLGTVPVSLQQNGAVLTGNVTTCNGNPVTNGYVVVAGFGYNSIINITNGVFSAAAAICPGTNAYFIAYDRETSQQSDLHNVTLTSGENNAGTLQACTSPATETITVAITSVGSSLYALPQYLFGGNFYFLNDSTSINAVDLLNGSQQVVQFSFTGPAAPGNYPLSNNTFSSSDGLVVFANTTSVNIALYGLIGEFITGSFSGQASLNGGPLRNYEVNFNIKRDQ